jgi:hypothetical protein
MKKLSFGFLFTLTFLFTHLANSQTTEVKKPKGRFYFCWGYNKDWHSKSDLHFESKSSDDFNFTVYDVSAIDRPGFDKIFNSNLSIPQFIYRFGYMFAKHSNMGIEIGFDHAKYIMKQNQVAHVKGKIFENYVDNDTVLSRNFLRFEHTNGANFLMVSFIWKNVFLQNKKGTNELSCIIKPGIGITIPQSQVYLFGVDQNNKYHIAGYVTGLDLELHYEYKKHLIIETGIKGNYANYLDVLSIGDSRANHHFFCLEWLLAVGYQFQI